MGFGVSFLVYPRKIKKMYFRPTLNNQEQTVLGQQTNALHRGGGVFGSTAILSSPKSTKHQLKAAIAFHIEHKISVMQLRGTAKQEGTVPIRDGEKKRAPCKK